MSTMNFNFGLLIYEDPQETNPQIRVSDIHKDYQSIQVEAEKSSRVSLAPGESKTVAATSRSIPLDGTTELEISRPVSSEDTIRMSHTGTGTAPGFRAQRNLGVDATTVVSLSRIAPNTVRLSHDSGTSLDTSQVQVGDILKFERTTDNFTSLFSVTNQGVLFKVQSKGSGHIDFLDNGAAALDTSITLGSDFDQQLRVFSDDPVQIGDTIELSGSLNSGNLGKFEVVNLAHDYIEFVNPFAVAETFTNSNNVVLYENLIGFAVLRANRPFKLRFDNQSADFRVGVVQDSEAFFAGSVLAHTLVATNDEDEHVSLSVQHVSLC